MKSESIKKLLVGFAVVIVALFLIELFRQVNIIVEQEDRSQQLQELRWERELQKQLKKE